jgi:hypothetical protein
MQNLASEKFLASARNFTPRSARIPTGIPLAGIEKFYLMTGEKND